MTNPVTSSATRLRAFLFIALGLSIIAIAALVVYGVQYLDKYAAEVNQTVYESTTSDERLAAVRRQVESLEQNQSAVERARQIVADSQSYMYQDVIIRDLQYFANKAGIQIVNFDFATQAAEDSQTPATTPAAPTPGGPIAGDPDSTGPPGVEPTQPTAPQLKSTTVNIALANPVDYKSLLQFINYIEQNLTKMQISSVSLSRAGDDDSKVTSDSLTIEVYVR